MIKKNETSWGKITEVNHAYYKKELRWFIIIFMLLNGISSK